MEECLAYFRQAIEHPGSVPPWSEWWAANEDLVRRSFVHDDCIKLKFRRLDAARVILQRLGQPAVEPQVHVIDRIYCPHCGERLLKVVPGSMPSHEEVLVFAKRAGRDQCSFHPGVYCPLGCVSVLMEFRRLSDLGNG